jgi:shikimate kinase
VSGLARRHLVLVGLMGVGKSTVGARCGIRLGRPFVDTDDLVELLAGARVAELFARGEEEFRAVERAAVADACAAPASLVIACGGGAVLDAGNRALLHACGFVVWLRAEPAVLAERVEADGVERPLLARDHALAALTELAARRDAVYRAVADAAVATDHRTPEQVADAVLEEFAGCAA